METEQEIIQKIKEKKEFSQIPDSVVLRVLSKDKNLDEKSRIKNVRAILRKFFTAFLTNKILKGKLSDEEVLKKHISTKNRDYKELYKRILKEEASVIDLGAGVNGFSYKYLGKREYVGVEGVGQLVKLMQEYFNENKFNAQAVHADLFDTEKVLKIIKETKKPRIVFMFNIIDALEFLERDFSKEFILKISEECERVVLSFPTQSLSGKTRFKARRYWILNFIEEKFEILDEFETGGERFVVFKRASARAEKIRDD